MKVIRIDDGVAQDHNSRMKSLKLEPDYQPHSMHKGHHTMHLGHFSATPDLVRDYLLVFG